MPKIEMTPPRSLNLSSTKLMSRASNAGSEAGEDGIISAIFELIRARSRWCAELGAGDGIRSSNILNLFRNQGWRGTQIEKNAERHAQLVKTFGGSRGVRQVCVQVGFDFGVDGFDDVLAASNAPKTFDLLSIAVRGNSWHFWDSLIEHRPRVAVIRHNCSVPNDVIFVQDRDPDLKEGCSLAALVGLGRIKGYELCAVTAAHALFVDKQEFMKLGIRDNSVDAMWTGAPGRVFSGYNKKIYHTMSSVPWVGGELPPDIFQLPAADPPDAAIPRQLESRGRQSQFEELRATSPHAELQQNPNSGKSMNQVQVAEDDQVASALRPNSKKLGVGKFLRNAKCISSAGLAAVSRDRWALVAAKQENPSYLFSFETGTFVHHAILNFGTITERPAARASYTRDGITWNSVEKVEHKESWHLPVHSDAKFLCITFEGMTTVSTGLWLVGEVRTERTRFGEYDSESGVYTVTHNAGFFSNVTVAVVDVLQLLFENKDVTRLDMQRSFAIYADRVDDDVYGCFFEADGTVELKRGIAQGSSEDPGHERYAKLGRRTFGGWPIDAASAVIKRFFKFRREYVEQAERAVASIGIVPAETICVYYRATDKAKEFELPSIEKYVEVCERLIARNPRLRVLVQTDDARVLDSLTKRLGDRAVFLRDVPVSKDGKPVHLIATGNRLDSLKPFIVSFLVMARCKYIVATSSNVSFAFGLYRGSGDNIFVFYSDGRVADYLNSEDAAPSLQAGS